MYNRAGTVSRPLCLYCSPNARTKTAVSRLFTKRQNKDRCVSTVHQTPKQSSLYLDFTKRWNKVRYVSTVHQTPEQRPLCLDCSPNAGTKTAVSSVHQTPEQKTASSREVNKRQNKDRCVSTVHQTLEQRPLRLDCSPNARTKTAASRRSTNTGTKAAVTRLFTIPFLSLDLVLER